MRVLHVLAVAVAVFCLANDSARAASRFDGDWIGWAYINDGGDFPLRLHVNTDDVGTNSTIDFPHARMFEIPPDSFEVHGSQMRLVRLNSKGERWDFRGRVKARTITGTFMSEGEPYGNFELHRSPVSLPTVDPDSYADAAGAYRFESGRLLILSPRFWGEMLYRDLGSGRCGTLIPTSSEQFFAGGAMYVPSPVFAQLKLLRNTSGQVTGVSWQEGRSAAELAIKTPLIEEEVTFNNAEVTLTGTLIRPSGAGPHPAAVILGGSGWTTRGTVRGDAEVLASMGLATLVYDKRGYGDSTGEQIVPFADSAEDALAAVRYLQGRIDINAQQVGLTGRSRGGWLAPLAASRSKEVAFLVLFVPPAVSPAAQEQTRRLNSMRDAGASKSALKAAEHYLGLQWRFAQSEEGWDDYLAARAHMDSLGWLDHVLGPETPEPEEWLWARLNMHYDPLPTLEQVSTPVLAFFGGTDRNVVTKTNKPLMQAALTKAENPDFELVVVPKANHGLSPVSKPPRPLHRKTHLAPGVWSKVQDWLAERLDLVANVSRKRDHTSR